MTELVNRYDIRLVFSLAKWYADLLKQHHQSKSLLAAELASLMNEALDMAYELTKKED